MHGRLRDAEAYRDAWCGLTEQRGILLLVPEFGVRAFPGARSYNQGGVRDGAGEVVPRTRWAFGLVEEVVDHACDRFGGPLDRAFAIYGHSAGAQFVHRLVLLAPSTRIRRAVAANAGWYTLIDPDEPYPWGLAGLGLSAADIRRSLEVPLTILLGEDDTDPQDERVRHDAVVDRQGLDRFSRGRYFMAAVEAWAGSTGHRWQLRTVERAGHVDADMRHAAFRLLEERDDDAPSRRWDT
jgi:hypothetical protein